MSRNLGFATIGIIDEFDLLSIVVPPSKNVPLQQVLDCLKQNCAFLGKLLICFICLS